jgi:ABC-type lipoprotein release transport system permease subunit
MTQLFGLPSDILTTILLIVTLIIVGGVLLLALSNLLFFKIGVRNIPRRRTQMILIVFALMLSTTLLSSILAIGDVVNAAVQSVAIYNLGNVDETVEGGNGALGFFDDWIYYRVSKLAKNDPNIAAVGAAMIETNLLVADENSRQVRSKVTAFGIIPGSEQGFGGMQNDNGKGHFQIASLGLNEVYLNHTAALLLNAHPGDLIYLYSKRWPGQRFGFYVRAIVANGGLTGDTPTILSQIQAFRNIEHRHDDITKVFISNRGGGGVSGVGLTDSISEEVEGWIPRYVHVIQVKQQGVQDSQKVENIFSRVFDLFSLFVLAIGLLLIFLIFVLLAAERRTEMGMARAIGVQRRHLVLMFLFEGTVYDLIASFIGLGFGVGVGVLLVIYLGPVLARFDFPLTLTFRPGSLVIAYCLGVIFTFFSVALASWLVSRMTVVEAIRNLPESGKQRMSLGEMWVELLALVSILLRQGFSGWFPLFRRGGRGEGRGPLWSPAVPSRVPADEIEDWLTQEDNDFTQPSHPQSSHRSATQPLTMLSEDFPDLPDTPSVPREYFYPETATNDRRTDRTRLLEKLSNLAIGLLVALTQLGILPLLAGYALLQLGLDQQQIAFFSLGLTLIVVGGALVIKAAVEQALRLLNKKEISMMRMVAAVAGLAILAYWALPFDVLAWLGLPRFYGGLEVFFLAGLMMVLGAAWALISNAELLVGPLLALSAWQPGLHIMTKLASAYPLHHRFRTGLSVVMFSLVIFAMTVMVVITNAMQNTYTNINVQTGGYDIQAVAYFKPLPVSNGPNGPAISSLLASHGIDPRDFSSIGVSNTAAVGVIQPSAQDPAWHLYPAQVVSGAFLQGLGIHLTARAQGFNSDSAVWKALQSNSHYALIDSSALQPDPNSLGTAEVTDPNAPSASDAGSPTYPPGFDPYYTFSLGGIYQDTASFAPIPIWVANQDSRSAFKLTIIGVVDNSDNSHFGLYIPRSVYGKINTDPSMPDTQTYYFKVAPGQDKRALALALGSAFLDNGLETTVLEDAVWETRGPRILLSNILLGVVGLALLLGVAALAITGTRAVIERRQQIGMLRALGCSRRLLQAAFLCESFLVGCIGSLLGVTLGLILSRNIFAVNFFERYQTGLTFSIPWGELGLIVGIALLASLLAALLPAWQAGRVTPMEALRYS